ncbi:alpha-glucosidase C-terminal domain-containing protein [Flavobacterium sp.]|uniref:alpha-amylase family glycosyl hydrolase n=1 Tax=Flavobacterium sp. TaxID=239 RepID=UPI00260B5064|nr:alpha-glucosidase C-terminal domain-containing protein [Flavobacterium sp.]
MKKLLIVFVILYCIATAAAQEIIYETNSPAFFDSNNDAVQDEEGIMQRIEYLYRLGFTSVMLGENYLPGFTETIYDNNKLPEGYTSLITTLKKRGFKVYQAVNISAVSDNHPWYTESLDKPASAYSRYIMYADKQNKQPVRTAGGMIALNVKEPAVKEYFIKVLGSLSAGLDGLRLQQQKHSISFGKEFWNPVTEALKKVNPEMQVFLMPEEGATVNTYFNNVNADKVYAGTLSKAIIQKDKRAITAIADSIFKSPDTTAAIVYLDTPAQGTSYKEGQLKAFAAANILLGGLPSVTSGQEYYGSVSANEAFVWKEPLKRSEKEAWLKEKGLEWEQAQKNELSLWNFYRELISLKRRYPSIGKGTYKYIENSAPNVLTFVRDAGTDKAFVMINLSGEQQEVTMTDYNFKLDALLLVMGSANYNFKTAGRTVVLPPYQVQVWRIMK